MNVVRLSRQDHALLCARFAEHGNSQRRMRDALEEAAVPADVIGRLCALREMERALEVDLGAVCWRWEHRNDEATHPLERQIMEYVAEPRGTGSGWELWVRLDSVHALRELMEGRLVGEPE
ncbi:MAG: hypothetical protein GX539_13140 [Candidatus Cloacimonetes bacterium]|jgi:hypothetical protein|nr:hypothetical protein [Candidatus Cloacimonadota bacterium]